MRRAERHPRGRLKSRVGETPLVSGWRKRSVMLPKGQTARYGVSSERFTWSNKLSGQTHALWRTIVQPQGFFLSSCSRRYYGAAYSLGVHFSRSCHTPLRSYFLRHALLPFVAVCIDPVLALSLASSFTSRPHLASCPPFFVLFPRSVLVFVVSICALLCVLCCRLQVVLRAKNRRLVTISSN